MPSFIYAWQAEYAAALTELDASRLEVRVREAQAVLQKRIAELDRKPDGAAEREAIRDALFMLDFLTKG